MAPKLEQDICETSALLHPSMIPTLLRIYIIVLLCFVRITVLGGICLLHDEFLDNSRGLRGGKAQEPSGCHASHPP
uniref:Uncharacterized protein n=1 Tax=Mycena chlorophos TaxID=658473 RepID=A0ABQ0LHC5_MYCCL|nr:predicted protein [Mycena chlorophos]